MKCVKCHLDETVGNTWNITWSKLELSFWYFHLSNCIECKTVSKWFIELFNCSSQYYDLTFHQFKLTERALIIWFDFNCFLCFVRINLVTWKNCNEFISNCRILALVGSCTGSKSFEHIIKFCKETNKNTNPNPFSIILNMMSSSKSRNCRNRRNLQFENVNQWICVFQKNDIPGDHVQYADCAIEPDPLFNRYIIYLFEIRFGAYWLNQIAKWWKFLQ